MRLYPPWNSSRRRYHMRAATVTLSLTANLFGRSTLDAQVGQPREIVCHSEVSLTISALTGAILPNRDRLELDEAWMDFRFNRSADALAKINRAAGAVRGAWGLRLPPDVRKDLSARLAVTRTCITTQPTPLATITLQAFFYKPEAANEREPAGAGVTITVDSVPIGRTDGDSTLTAKVPSGPVHVAATISPAWGEAFIDLTPGDTAKAIIVLDPDKEAGETSDLMLAEAVDDIIPATTKTFTFKFMRNGAPVPISEISLRRDRVPGRRHRVLQRAVHAGKRRHRRQGSLGAVCVDRPAPDGDDHAQRSKQRTRPGIRTPAPSDFGSVSRA